MTLMEWKLKHWARTRSASLKSLLVSTPTCQRSEGVFQNKAHALCTSDTLRILCDPSLTFCPGCVSEWGSWACRASEPGDAQENEDDAADMRERLLVFHGCRSHRLQIHFLPSLLQLIVMVALWLTHVSATKLGLVSKTMKQVPTLRLSRIWL